MKKKEIKKAIEDRISTLKNEMDVMEKYDIEMYNKMSFALNEMRELLKQCFPKPSLTCTVGFSTPYTSEVKSYKLKP